MFLQICAFCCTLLYFGTYILNKLHGYWELNPFAIFERLKEDIWLQGRRKNHNWNQEEELIHYWWKMSSLFYRVRLSFKLFALPCLRRSGFIHLIGKNPSVKSDEKIKWWNYLPMNIFDWRNNILANEYILPTQDTWQLVFLS